jgi:transposase
MSRTYDAATKANAVRLFTDHVADYESPWAAMKAISGRLGMTTETLRRWVRESEVTPEQTAAAESAQQVRDLKRKVRELEATVEVLQAATAFFTRAHDPLQR